MADNSELVNALSGGGLLSSIANPRVISPNLLADSYEKASGIANSLWRNKLFQSQQAAGQAALKAVDPATGQFSAPQLNQNLAADADNTALSAQDSMQRGSTNAGTDFDVHMKRLTGMNAAAVALTAQYPNGVPLQAIQAELKRVGPIYGLTPQELAQGEAQFGADPVANSRTIIRNSVSNLTAQDALHASRPGATTVDMGPAVVGANVAPAAADQPGALNVPPGQGVQLQTGPGTRAAETPVFKKMADGTYQQVPEARSARPGASGAATNYAGKPNPLLGGLLNPQEGGQESLSAPPQGQPDQLAAGNKVYTDAATAVPDQQKRLIAGESALQALDIAKTGPGTGMVGKAKAFFEAQGITTPEQGTMSAVDYRQVLVKNLLRFAQDKSKGTGTDLGLETQLHSNANADEMLPNANRHVLVQDLGILRRDMGQTATMPRGAAAIDHVKDFSASIDPRAFATKYMTADEIGAMVDRMGTKERQKFLNSLKVANDAGHVDLK